MRGELSQFVDDIIVPQNMIKWVFVFPLTLILSLLVFIFLLIQIRLFRVIMETDVSDRTFLEQLHELQHKINFVRAQEFKDARAVYDVMGVLESLKFKVCPGNFVHFFTIL